ncbi:AraC family transcriptional regulator [uncultured Paenibacillus sp.]|uniref:helix-turn-helix transcriptional regulator n=1 Tax=uncultured Paenibacillus sp. TaxID=227322 RepID=UPI0015B1F0AC|nr:AraC family transcriptional regulator [uncultured Paenibacillus sp.]
MKSLMGVLFNDKYRSLFYRLSAALALLVLMVALGFLIFNSAYNHLQQKSKLEDLSTKSKTLFKNYYNNLFQDMDNKSVELSNNKKLMNMLKKSDEDMSLINIINNGSDFCCVVSIDIYTRDQAFRYNHGQILDIPLMSDDEWAASRADVMKGAYWKIDEAAGDASSSPPTVHILRSIPNIASDPIGFLKINLNSRSLFQNPFQSGQHEKIWLESPSHLLFSLNTGLLDQAAMAGGLRFEPNASGSIQLERENYFYNVVPARLSGWNFVYAVPEGTVSKGISFGSFLWLMFFILFILLIFYAFVLIRSVFGKIRTIQEVVGNSSAAGATKGTSFSLNVLINSVASLKEHRENIEWMYRKNIPILKKALCYRLLYHDRGEWPEIREQMSQLGFTFPTSVYSVVLFRIDKYYDFLQNYNKADQSLLRFFAYKMAEEIGGQHFKVLMWNTESRDIVMIANALVSMEEEVFEVQIESAVHSIVEHINNYLKITITAVIGPTIQDARQIPDSWNRVVNFMESKRFGGCHVLKCRDHERETPFFAGMLEASRGRKDALLQAVKSNDIRQIDEELERTKGFLESLDGYPMIFIQQLLIDVVMSAAYALMEMGSKPQVDKIFAELHLEMQRIESIEEAMAWFKKKLFHWLESMESDRSDHAGLMSHVLEYVNANYDREISLGGIAAELQLNIAHLSRLFKKSTGKNFMDYLIDLRIERAKQMLTDSAETVQRIGEKVGYVNTQSFIRIFKKNVGVTPGQFRECKTRETVKHLDAGKVY